MVDKEKTNSHDQFPHHILYPTIYANWIIEIVNRKYELEQKVEYRS